MKLTKREQGLKDQAFSNSAPMRHLVQVRRRRAADRLERDMIKLDAVRDLRLVGHLGNR